MFSLREALTLETDEGAELLATTDPIVVFPLSNLLYSTQTRTLTLCESFRDSMFKTLRLQRRGANKRAAIPFSRKSLGTSFPRINAALNRAIVGDV